MTRRFRRRPSITAMVLLALAVVVLARFAYDRIRQRSDIASPGFFQEGECDVVRVIDGDSIVVRQTVIDPTSGQRTASEATIRLLGIDCPEFDEPWGSEATSMTRRLLDAPSVSLRFDRRRVDRYERLLAYVFSGEQMVNVELVRAGLARAEVYPGDSQAIGRVINKAEAEAKAAGRGVWGAIPDQGR